MGVAMPPLMSIDARLRRGSGTGAMLDHGKSIEAQVVEGIRHGEQRYRARKFIAYFQSFTNTYGTVPQLKEVYDKALGHEEIVGLSIGTRPDCVSREVLDLLASYREKYLVWIELGLQSAHDATLQRINRGHDVAAFERAVRMADRSGLNVCAHVILGLPGETPGMMRQTAHYVGRLPLAGIKIHLLYVVRDTPLAKCYEEGGIRCLERDEYIDLVADFLERIPPAMVVQRLTGDPFGVDLVAPLWAKEKTGTLNRIRKRLEERDTWQGKKHRSSIAGR